MVSNILNLHPGVLSLSECFSYLGIRSFRPRQPTGDWMWERLSRQQNRTRLMLRGRYEELAYPFDEPGARFTVENVPPILCATLPNLTEQYQELFDELEPVVRGQRKQPPGEHFRNLFEWLCKRYDCRVWVERSGGSLTFGARLLRAFPEARVIHVYRDGRETAISMSRHYLFRMITGTMLKMKSVGYDAMESLARGRYWDTISFRLEPLSGLFLDPSKLAHGDLPLAEFGRLWNSMIERADRMLGDFPPDRLMNVKFEDVQADPEPELRRLIRFIDPGLEDDAWLRQASAVPHQSRSKFADLNARDQAALNDACRSGLERLGYPL